MIKHVCTGQHPMKHKKTRGFVPTALANRRGYLAKVEIALTMVGDEKGLIGDDDEESTVTQTTFDLSHVRDRVFLVGERAVEPRDSAGDID